MNEDLADELNEAYRILDRLWTKVDEVTTELEGLRYCEDYGDLYAHQLRVALNEAKAER